MALRKVEVGANAPPDEGTVGLHGPVAGDVGEPLHHNQRPVDGDGTRGGRQDKVQAREILLGGVHREPEKTAGRTRGESLLATRRRAARGMRDGEWE